MKTQRKGLGSLSLSELREERRKALEADNWVRIKRIEREMRRRN